MTSTATFHPVDTGFSLKLCLTAFALLLTCFISGQALSNFGVNYVLGANPLAKIHPGTYLAFFSVMLLYVIGEGPRINRVLFVESPALVYLAISLLVILAYAGILLSVPGTGLPDTWLLPICVFILCALLSRTETRHLARILDGFFMINSLLGIYEVAFNQHLVTITVANALLGVMSFPYEWRAGAFLGHPLTNAYLTGAYILLLIMTPRIRTLSFRIPLLLLHSFAMFAFGSRAATVLTGLFAVAYIGSRMFKGLATGRLEKDMVVYSGLLTVLSVTVVPVVLASGFADRFIERFSVDNGSAQARTGALDMLASFSWTDLVFGPPLQFTIQLGEKYGVGAGIESFFLGFLMTFGILGCLIFWPPLFLFCRAVYYRTNIGCAYVMTYFFICCATSVSLSSKSLSLGILVAMCFTSVDPNSPPFARRRRNLAQNRVSAR
jgi:hypothetical protein